jgi:hypothetical protein
VRHTEYFRVDESKDFAGSSSVVEHDAEEWAKDQYDRLAKQVKKERDAWLKKLKCEKPCGTPQVVADSVPSKRTGSDPTYGTRGRHTGWRGTITVECWVEVDCGG